MINVSSEIRLILNLIENNDYEAYIVGGYVRDSLLNKESYDVDITTSAPPSVLKDIFKDYDIEDNFINYGSLKFNIGKYHIEITTFRKEYDYINHRKPNKVEFTNSLKEDLIRRDFTINALCFNHGIIDEFEGVKDLNNKIIKTIGDPLVRFEEDALRILRAMRFSSKLGFAIDERTKRAIQEKYMLLKGISFTTIHKEIIGLLNGKNYISVLKEYKNELMEIFSLVDLKVELFDNEMNIEEKEALFFYYSTIHINNIYLKNKDIVFINDKVDLKKKLYKEGKENIYNVLLFRSKILKENQDVFILLKEILNNNECYNLKQLDIKGKDLLNLNVTNNKIGKHLEQLLNSVIENKCENKKDELINFLKNNIIKVEG